MHPRTLHGILFPRMQRGISSSNAGVNWRRGILIINKTLMHAHKLQTITVYKAILFVGYKLYFNLYGMFPIKSNDITFTAHIVSKILNNNNNNI